MPLILVNVHDAFSMLSSS